MATLDMTNSSLETVIFEPMEMLLDLRSIGYYKIKQGILQQNLSKYYRFELANTLCEHFNKFINILKQERKDKMKESCSKLVISVTEHLVEVVDKLSTTVVVFFRSEEILKCKCLYGA